MLEAPRLNFMILGAQKAGTTALSSFLDQHPMICMARPKEAHVFDSPEYSREKVDKAYNGFFDHFAGEPLVGEATPIYLYWTEIAAELYHYNPDLKIIILLRNPIERAYSQYSMEKLRELEKRSFLSALIEEKNRLANDKCPRSVNSASRCHSYMNRGRYREQIEKLKKYFDPSNILLLDSERMRNQHQLTLQRVFEFLKVSNDIGISSKTVFEGPNRAMSSVEKFLLSVIFRSYVNDYRQLLEEVGN